MRIAASQDAPSCESIEPLVLRELEVDLGLHGDVTSQAVVPPTATATGRLLARREGRVCGLGVAALAFELAGGVEVEPLATDGTDVHAGGSIARVCGPARSILAAERTALNFLGHLSGVATATRDLCRAIEGTGASVTCTRKTTPGLRALEKYAVRIGGGRNHRMDLSEAVLIKDNHRALAGGVAEAVRRSRAASGSRGCGSIQVEVETLEELREALAVGVDAVLLDNFSIEDLRRAVSEVGGRVLTEASGGVRADNIRRVAGTGVDRISVGWITHSAPALDVSLELDPGPLDRPTLASGRRG